MILLLLLAQMLPVSCLIEVEILANAVEDRTDNSLVIFTVATDNNDPYQRFVRSLKVFNLDQYLETLGLNQEWLGGDMNHPGGGFKVTLLKEAMYKYKNDVDRIVMFTDSYDVVFLADEKEIVDKFRQTGASLVISAEDFIWPDKSLTKDYPKIEGKQYLCSGGMIGYASTFWEILHYKDLKNTDDDQLFYTHAYLDAEFREKHKIQLDGTSSIFQNLHGAVDELDMGFGAKRLTNMRFGTMPSVLHGNGPSKLDLNRLGNYYPAVFDPTVGDKGKCLICEEADSRINTNDTDNLPLILTSLFITERTPFLDYFINTTFSLNYPKSKWHMRIYNLVEVHSDHLQELVNYHVHNSKEEQLASFELRNPQDIKSKNLMSLYDNAMSLCKTVNCGWYYVMDSVITIADKDVLLDLMSHNRSIITTQLSQPGQYWSNFWGGVNSDGFYYRSKDYFDVVERKRQSLWNVPFVNHLLAVRGDVIAAGKTKYTNKKYDDSNYDVAFAANARENNVFMFMVNTKQHGHLKRMDNYTSDHTHNDLWQIFVNPIDWKLNYVHPDYSKYLVKKRPQFPQPCPDVFAFPLVSEKFSWHIIHELEVIPNIFSPGSNNDKRLDGGYENVPTVDVHFTQINFQQEWLKVLKDYIIPIQKRIFEGFHSDGKALLSFVVKYHEEGQRLLRPHHDHSTYTTNTALNRQGLDYEGGGSYFIRQNCGVPSLEVGWTLMHPGRLTHYHEGKEISRGTRYILVSFNDP